MYLVVGATGPVGLATLLCACGFANPSGASRTGPNTGVSGARARTGAIAGAVARVVATGSGAGAGTGAGARCATALTTATPNQTARTIKTRFMTHLASSVVFSS